MAELSLLDAVNTALSNALAADERVVLLGQDIGIDGGVFRATDGLLQRFGPGRVMDTPLCETAITGIGIGLATQNFRPVVEIQFMGFLYSALDQLINHASRLRNRTRGRLSCPMVLRVPFGGGVRAPEHHSESTEAMLAHIPGLRVVIPSSPSRAYGLLRAAIDDPDPVVFLEPKRLYRALTESVDETITLPLDRCVALREGRDVTIVTWGAMTQDALAAAAQLSEEGAESDVIDVQTLKPLDAVTILDSVARTGRLVIAHEAPLTGGFGAEISARVAEYGLFDLKAPIVRVAGYDTVMPLARLEHAYMPTSERIVAAARKTLDYS